MNPKLTYFSGAIVISVLILVLGWIVGSTLHDPKSFFLSIFGIILFVNVTSFFLSRQSASRKDK